MIATKTIDAINKAYEDDQDSGFRWHLGASLIGRECGRQLWYIHRWALKVKHGGQLLRLFERGELEELRFNDMLRRIGCKVWEVDPVTGKQFRITDSTGHYGGSLDVVAVGLPDVPDGLPALGEYKTHGQKSFDALKKQGLRKTKWEHFIQMQEYMNAYDLQYGVYFAVCKNTDELYCELVELESNTADRYMERARMIITSTEAPDKCNKNPAWWKCKICDFNSICHKGAAPDINCRTCAHSTPVDEGKWVCQHTGAIFTKEQEDVEGTMEKGCKLHVFNPHLLGAEVLKGNAAGNWLEIKHPKLGIIKIGPNNISSNDLALIMNSEEELDYWLHGESDSWGVDPTNTQSAEACGMSDIVDQKTWLKIASKGGWFDED